MKYLTTNPTRQIFITTHSTHITAAAGLEPIIHLSIDASGQMLGVNPSDCFKSDNSGLTSKRYVERYLDATKSNMLFCKGVLFVEGISEQLLIPALAEYLPGCDLDKRHVAIINVGGSTFRHFLPLFGAGTPPDAPRLRCRVACIPDGDPTRKRKNQEKGRYHKCYPYEVDADQSNYEYQPVSSVVTTLAQQTQGSSNIQVTHSAKTLEYDLAYDNENSTLVLTDSCTNKTEMEHLVLNKGLNTETVAKLLSQSTIQALKNLDSSTQAKAVFASAYLESLENSKGEHALALADALRKNARRTSDKQDFAVPEYVKQALEWVCSEESH
ncbi:MAG: hypothetical protein NTU41_05160 [Chloroflexi bacterium]|nr:hypothetical protein [Chloroflexota bacterium]